MKMALAVIGKVLTTLILASLLTRGIFTSGFIGLIFFSDPGLEAYRFLCNALNIVGGEDGEVLIIVIVLSVMLPVSGVICWALPGWINRTLKTHRSR